MILADPRGFNIAISIAEFFNLLSECNGNLVHNEFELELCYAWNEFNSRPMLISTKNPYYEKLVAKSKKAAEQQKNENFVTPKNLVYGKVYKGNSEKGVNGLFVYLGKHDVYSTACQKIAFRYSSYKYLKYFTKDNQDMSGEDRFVFYRLGADGVGACYDKSHDPYLIRSGIGKLFFDEEVKNVKLEDYHLYNDWTKDCTLPNLEHDLKTNFVFNRIKFDAEKEDEIFTSMSMRIFNNRRPHYNAQRHENMTWPVDVNGNENFFSQRRWTNWMSSFFKPISLEIASYHRDPKHKVVVYEAEEYQDSERQYYYYGNRQGKKLDQFEIVESDEDEVTKTLYDYFNPQIRILYLENGEEMNLAQASLFTEPKCEFSIVNNYYFRNHKNENYEGRSENENYSWL